MDLKKYIKAEQKIISSDLNIYEKSLMQYLIIKANQFVRGEDGDIFKLVDSEILKGMGLSEKSNNTLRKARNNLIEHGYITFNPIRSGSKSEYTINWYNIIGKEPIHKINEE